MLDLLTAGPRMGMRALDDLHSLAVSLRRLTADDGDLHALTEAASRLPVVEDQLSANVAALRDDVEHARHRDRRGVRGPRRRCDLGAPAKHAGPPRWQWQPASRLHYRW